MATFEPLDEELVHRGHVIELHRCRFRAPDGSVIERDVVRHPGAVSVVALDEHGSVVLVRQFRAPLGREMLEIPAGKRDVPGEPLEETARRELAEETGLDADHVEPLISFHNSVGFSDEECHVFLATGLHEVGHRREGPEEQHMEVMRVALDDVPALIASGAISDAKTVIGVLAAQQRV